MKIRKVILFFSVLSAIVSSQKVFGMKFNRVWKDSSGSQKFQQETKLLLSDPDGLLQEADSRKVIQRLRVPVMKQLTVGKNEWLEKIAKDFGVPSLFIRSTNNLEDPLLRPNQQIIIQNKKGMVHVVRKEEPLEAIIKRYEKLGGKRKDVFDDNLIDELTFLRDGQLYAAEGSRLFIAGARLSFPWMAMPVRARRISSFFGFRRHPISKTRKFHEGYDMSAPVGAPVHSGQEGVVIYTGWLGGYGNVVEIRHTKVTTRYGHLSKIYVNTGEKVKRKQLIGRVGSTGLSTGPHLHFEVRRNSDGRPIRPGRYLY